MKSMVIIIPYFSSVENGRFPNYFSLWMSSVRMNPTVDFILITNMSEAEQIDEHNVKVVKMQFAELINRVQRLFDFRISLDTPYKLCDFKPAYGEIFEELISDYDYWGFGDIDLVYGNIRKFVTDDVLENYDRINERGHLSIFPNTFESNRMYRTLACKGNQNWKNVFSTSQSCAFDEIAAHRGGGLTKIYRANGLRIFDKEIYADLQVNSYWMNYGKTTKKHIFEFDASKGLFSVIETQGRIYKEELLYVHFQKRPLKINQSTNIEHFLILPPNKVESADGEINVKKIRKALQYRAFWVSYKMRRRIKKFTGISV